MAERGGGWARLRGLWPELTILAVAVWTRLWQLDYHSFWFDEAVSLRWARSGANYIWQSTLPLIQDKHPPGYYLLLHGWINLLELLGLAHSDWALRLLGALLGVLTVVGLGLLVQRLSGRSVALLAAALTALSPVLVWYSQELRMFQPATTGIVWAGYALLRGWQGQRALARLGWWVLCVGAFTFALYSYLFSAFVLPAAGLALVGLWGAERQARAAAGAASGWRRLLEGFCALTVTLLLFLPLAYSAWGVNAREGMPGVPYENFGAQLLRQLQVMTVWRAPWLTAAVAPWLLTWLALLLSAGLFLRVGRERHDQLWLCLWLGVPLAVGGALLGASDTVFAEDRYFLFLAPYGLWALARGAVAVGLRWRPAGWAAGAVTALLLAGALPSLWSPERLREDWRAAAAYLAGYQQQSPGLAAAAFSHAEYTNLALRWYLRQWADEQELPVFYPYTGRLEPGQSAEVEPPVRGLEDLGTATLWLVQSHLEGVDRERVVEGWLDQNFPVVTEQYPAGIQVTGYALRHRFTEVPPLADSATWVDVELVPGLRLLACEVTTPVVTASDFRMHPPSGWVHVRLWWQATAAVEQAYMPDVQLVGPEGVWGERLYRDGEILRRDPPSQWPAGSVVRDEVDVNLNPATPPGSYPLQVRLRDPAGQEVGEQVACGSARVVSP